jgi:beta-1,4-mannooligosaccharide/beta-1,4-mannosyl-N-acetylglucosamine phosphorylase
VGAALLDRDEPWKIVVRGGRYLLSPQVPYEQVGDVPNVVFPSAALHDAPTGRFTLYYGAADTVVCMAHGYIPEIIELVRAHPV